MDKMFVLLEAVSFSFETCLICQYATIDFLRMKNIVSKTILKLSHKLKIPQYQVSPYHRSKKRHGHWSILPDAIFLLCQRSKGVVQKYIPVSGYYILSQSIIGQQLISMNMSLYNYFAPSLSTIVAVVGVFTVKMLPEGVAPQRTS